ncbi:hypothetical protein GPJ56_003201 [Histomonas meleagridis]|uniref:uncharacterized protein n=1 Tax=Histomonas meleagridis TaxID=135588 RepID=UPI00355AB6DF|nr:hypothetical protein GPJ56_003201 [Histomonas meleagridis]KAH0801234.1 hypothetical protein GO595_005829 [Histomonas meleagridis]
MSRKEMIKSLQIDDQPGLISELLLDYKSRSNASIQKESDDISSKLEAVELQIRKKRQFTRMQSSEDQLRRGLETIDRDYEIKFQKELNSRLEIFRSTELSQVKSDTLRRHETELEKIRVELESDLKKKTADLYVQFEKDSEVLRMKQREIEREICKWSDRKIEEIANEADCAEAAAIRADTEKKLKMIKERTMQIQRKVEERMRELEDIRLANNKAKRESEKLKLAIEIYRKSNES